MSLFYRQNILHAHSTSAAVHICVCVCHLNGSGAIFDDERVKETEAITGVTALIADELPQFMRHLLEIPGRCKNKCDTY